MGYHPAMRIVYFANKRVGLEVLRFLKAQGENIVALVVHTPEQQEYGAEIVAESGVAEEHIFPAPALKDPQTLEVIRGLRPDIGFSALFAHILKPEVLDLFPRGVLNVHPGYLPYNRGRNAHVWSIVEHTPAGATLHYMDDGMDTGPIVARQEVHVGAADTGGSLYLKLEAACVEVVRDAWAGIVVGKGEGTPQERSEGTSHRHAELEALSRIDLDGLYRAGDLLDVLRALTFPGREGAYFEADGRRVYLSLGLREEPNQT